MEQHSNSTWKTEISTFAKRVVATGLLLLAGSLVLPQTAGAQGLGGFIFSGFDADITVNEDATFDVVETISGEFFEERHGLFRNIPVDYVAEYGLTKSIVLTVERVQLNGRPVAYETYKEDGDLVVKIGSASETIIGPFVYEIAYEVDRSLLLFDEHDEIYWNVTGNDWGMAIPAASATVHLPGTLTGEEVGAACYTGAFGSTDENCEIVYGEREVVITSEDFLTIAVAMPLGAIARPSRIDQFLWMVEDNWDLLFVLLPLLAFVGLFSHWLRHGKDPKGRGVIIAEYEPPAELRPTEVGTLIDTRVHGKDFAAGIVDLAVRGYLTIEETEKSVLGMGRKEYTFRKQKNVDETMREYEKKILNGLFASGAQESVLSKIATKLAKAKESTSKIVYADLAEKGYYVKNPSSARLLLVGIGTTILMVGHIVGIAVLSMTDRPVAMLACYVTAGVFLLYAPFMPKKTPEGVRLFEQAKGFREFLRTAERDRIKWQEKEGLFEEYLPYAMVFGVADKWARVFEGVLTTAPAWYVGPRYTEFHPAEFTNDVSSFLNASAKAAAPSSSGGGYSGGGGSSGGGFGGGGGGSW